MVGGGLRGLGALGCTLKGRANALVPALHRDGAVRQSALERGRCDTQQLGRNREGGGRIVDPTGTLGSSARSEADVTQP